MSINYALKGGSGPFFFVNWHKTRAKNKFFDRLLDGKVISTIIAFIFAAIFTSEFEMMKNADGFAEYAIQFDKSIMFAAGWLLSVAPSMGEEHGAIGTTRHGWGPYLEWMPKTRELIVFGKTLFVYREGRLYGIKKGLQRGVWIGSIMAVSTGFLPFVFWSLLFVPMVFIGQEAYYRLTGKDSWVLSEPLIGLACYGPGTAAWILSL